jgi:hypothetical protein
MISGSGRAPTGARPHGASKPASGVEPRPRPALVSQSPEARAALSKLCEAYWLPVFRFLRREGRDEDSARD